MATATLEAIRNKVRRLTQSPSTAQLSNADLEEYINTFIAYDFPETLRLFSLHRPVTFSLQTNFDTYTDSTLVLDDLSDYITFNPPVYIAGYKVFYTQSEQEFYNLYPFNSSIQSTGITGDGVAFNFAGTLSGKPVLRGKVAFTANDSDGDGLILRDVNADGLLSGDGTGTINYTTGAYTLAFSGEPLGIINSQTVPYQAGRPTAVLYFNNSFTFRPVPDQPYVVQIEAFVQPTQLIENGDVPELEQWWQYIAYGAAKKVLEDRMDIDTVQMIMPEFNRQEKMVLRRTVVQQTNERTATIYSNSENGSIGSNNFGSSV